jgi:hypothetical protein
LGKNAREAVSTAFYEKAAEAAWSKTIAVLNQPLTTAGLSALRDGA